MNRRNIHYGKYLAFSSLFIENKINTFKFKKNERTQKKSKQKKSP